MRPVPRDRTKIVVLLELSQRCLHLALAQSLRAGLGDISARTVQTANYNLQTADQDIYMAS
jgi:hypothetical protein